MPYKSISIVKQEEVLLPQNKSFTRKFKLHHNP